MRSLVAVVILVLSLATMAHAEKPGPPKPETSGNVTLAACPMNTGFQARFSAPYYPWQSLGAVNTANGQINISIKFDAGSPGAEVKLVDANTGVETPKYVFTSANSNQNIVVPCGTWVVYISSANISYTSGVLTAVGW